MANRALWVVVFAFALSGCGDDTVDPSNPDAGPSKDATADGAHKDGGAVHQNDGGRAEASDDGAVE